MKCKICKKRISNDLEICPYCGNKIHHKSIYSLIIEILLVCIGVILLIMQINRLSHQQTNIDDYWEQYDGLSFINAIEKGYDEDNTLNMIEDYKRNLITEMKKNDFTNIDIEENCQRDELTRVLTATMTIHSKKKDYEYIIKVSYQKERRTHAFLTISSTRDINNQQFEILENDIKNILEYLQIENGYALLKQGYSNMDNNQYNSNDPYKITMKKEIYQQLYKFQYTIGY